MSRVLQLDGAWCALYERCIWEAVRDEISEGDAVLYIGARDVPFRCGEALRQVGARVTILEPWPENVCNLQHIPWLEEVICGDARTYESNRVWDVVMWLHGPEHVSAAELPGALDNIERFAKKLVVIAAPWGPDCQFPIDGNPYEVHLNGIEREPLEERGYEVSTQGLECQKAAYGSHDRTTTQILGIKRKEPRSNDNPDEA